MRKTITNAILFSKVNRWDLKSKTHRHTYIALHTYIEEKLQAERCVRKENKLSNKTTTNECMSKVLGYENIWENHFVWDIGLYLPKHNQLNTPLHACIKWCTGEATAAKHPNLPIFISKILYSVTVENWKHTETDHHHSQILQNKTKSIKTENKLVGMET